jgi:hypothetical protein
MRRSNQFIAIKFLLVCFIIFVFSFNAFSYFFGNGAGGGYGDGVEGTIGKCSTIETYIIEGAGYFLKANSDILSYLNRVELSDSEGIDYNERLAVLNSAYYNMLQAKNRYDTLIGIAGLTPYNENVIAALKDFNYDEFSGKNLLNIAILKEVESYLNKGDITGAFKNIRIKFVEIIDRINTIKGYLTSGKTAEITELWRLNQDFSQTLLFGQYIAEVFYAIR